MSERIEVRCHPADLGTVIVDRGPVDVFAVTGERGRVELVVREIPDGSEQQPSNVPWLDWPRQ